MSFDTRSSLRPWHVFDAQASAFSWSRRNPSGGWRTAEWTDRLWTGTCCTGRVHYRHQNGWTSLHIINYYNAAYALGLRYSSLRLTGHGLARAYRDETKRSPDCPFACECFASAFNHYFDRYYSAFPDLEMFFGSRGCFFKAKWEQDPEGMTYYVCPPFDESLMQLCADHALNALNQRSVRRATFVFAIPGGWTDFHALEQLKRSPRTVKITDYPKGLLPFIDYMAKKGRQIVYPTDICELVLTNILPSSSRSSSIRWY